MSGCGLTHTMTFKLTVFITEEGDETSYSIITSEPLMILTLFIIKDSCRLPVFSALGSSQFFLTLLRVEPAWALVCCSWDSYEPV